MRLGALLSLVFLLIPGPASATYPGANGEVIFQSSRDGDNEIYRLNGDGSGVTQLTDNTAADVNPVWSPDGQKIAFQSNRSANADVWVMDADGTDPAQLTNDSALDGSPTWSPDGTRIAFTSARDGDDEIWVMQADGSSQVQLTANGATDEDPAWGCVSFCSIEKIAFTSDRDGNQEIYLMADDGSNQENLTNHPATDREPNWWVGSGRIAYVSNRGLGSPGDSDLDIWDISPGGISGFVTDEPGDEVAPAYSPDGNWIVYEKVGADREIYVARSSGQDSVNITNAATNERAPDWKAVPNTNFAYPRPKGATPMRVPLVVAYPECTSPNRTHGPPLAFPSCAPPVPSSANVNVGNPLPDLSGAAANMMGSIRYDVMTGAPGPPDDSDVSISASIVDVRCAIRNTGSPAFPCGSPNSLQQNDYVGELEASVAIAITDRWNATVPAGGGDYATGSEFAQEVTIPCQATASNTTGGRCSVSTSLNTLAPGAVRDGKRAVWALGQVQVYDAGPDGTVANADGRDLFAVQGVFVP